DEAFIDYAPYAAVTAQAARRAGLVAVRSLTKFYGCPALRAGYAVAAPSTVKRVAEQLPSWPVSTLAMNALAEAVRDVEYERVTLDENERERDWLSTELRKTGVRVFPSSANFLLLGIPQGCSSAMLRDRLIREFGILIRNCDSFRGLEAG